MKNWNTDMTKFASPQEKRLWELEQMIDYGFDGVKVDKEELLNNWDALRDRINPEKRRLFELLLWSKIYSLPISKKSFYRQNEIKVLPIDSI